MSMTIVHVVYRDKFTNGYLRFMVSQFREYDHVFFTQTGKYAVNNTDIDQCFELDHLQDLTNNRSYLNILKSADKIIISGVWISARVMAGLLKANLIKKTFFFFWGGDFYCYRKPTHSIKEWAERRMFYYAFSKAAGLVFLIEGEYDEFKSITHLSNKNFVAPMPGDPEKQFNYSFLRR